MLFFRLFKWDENIVVSNNNLKQSNDSFKHIKLNHYNVKNNDFVDKILKEDPMFLTI